MSDKTWVEESPLASKWRNLKTEDSKTVEAFRRQVDPLFIPSGISGLTLSKGDHIALIVDEESRDYLEIIRDFLVAGYRNSSDDEILSLELTEKRDKRAVSVELEKVLGVGFDRRLDVRDWETNSSDYERGTQDPNTGRFTLPGMWQAMNNERRRMKQDWQPMLRCASEDCSLYIRWLENPLDYLHYESRLAADLERIVPSNFVQLCTFRSSMLREMEKEGVLGLQKSLAEILVSHNRVVMLDSDGLHLDQNARDRILSRYPIDFRVRAGARLRSILTVTRAKFGPSPQEARRAG